MKEFERPKGIGFLNVEVLPFLKDRKWDEVAWAYIHSLRPRSIRVRQYDEILEANASCWRVTVLLDGDKIREITQEVEVGLYDGMNHGHDLRLMLKGKKPSKPMPDGITGMTIVNSRAVKRGVMTRENSQD